MEKNNYEIELAQEKAKKTADEIKALAEAGSIELSNNELKHISGSEDGHREDKPQLFVCPRCGSTNMSYELENYINYAMRNYCRDCRWTDAFD